MFSNTRILGLAGRRLGYSLSCAGVSRDSCRNCQSCGSVRGSDTSEKMNNEVHHDAKKNTFFLNAKEGTSQAVLVYDWIASDVIDFHHTEVPVQFRGQGVAKVLAKAGLDFAVRENLKVILSCTYMAKYVADNPQPEYTQQLYTSKQ